MAAAHPSPSGLVSARDSVGVPARDSAGIPPAVPEDEPVAGGDISPFQSGVIPASIAPTSPSDHPFQQQQQQQKKKKRQGLFSCFGCCGVKHEAEALPPVPAPPQAGPHMGSVPTSGRLSTRLSHRDSTKRPFLRKMGSMAYSDYEWFDAHSKFEGPSGDHADLLAEVDQLSRQLSLQHGPWVPDPPLRFAGEMPQRYLPHPLDISRFCGYWARDYDRSTPPPQPIDVMLKINFFTRKVHDSIPGALVSETDKEMQILIKPGVVPPGLNRYTESYDHHSAGETTWMLRRDLRPGSSSGRMFMAVDGTIITRSKGHSLMGGSVDVEVEEYWRLEEGGNVLVCRQCAYHVATGNSAVQFLVGIKQPHPPKGWVK